MPEITVNVDMETLGFLKEQAEDVGATIAEYGGSLLADEAAEAEGRR